MNLYEIDKHYQEVLENGFSFDDETGEVLFDTESLDKLQGEYNEKIDNIKVVPSQLDTEFELVKDSKIAFKLDDSQNDLRILVPSNAAFEQ